MKGTHEIRFGFDFIHHLMNHWQPELGEGPRGSFEFGTAVTALNPAAIEDSVGFQGGTPSFENGWNGLAGFLLGTPTGSGKSSQFIKMNSLENQFALYVRDRWRVTPKLTLSLGLRWELYPTRTRSAGMGIESYDPTTNEVLVGGRGGIPRDAGVGYSKKLFAPRVGFAYQWQPHTVIRSGYGITFHSHPWGAQALRGWYPLTIVCGLLRRQRLPAGHDRPQLRGGGCPEPAAWRRCRHSANLLPRHQQGQDTSSERGRDGVSGRQPAVAPRLHPVVELHHRAQTAGRIL